MSEKEKSCKFYSFIRCEGGNCSVCDQHPLNQRGVSYMLTSERAELARACGAWLRANGLLVTPENIIDALCMNGAINPSKARDLIAKYPPTLSDSLRERRG